MYKLEASYSSFDPLQRPTPEECSRNLRRIRTFGSTHHPGTHLALTERGGLAPSNLSAQKENPMLWTIFVILLVGWLVGIVSSYTLGGYIHILLLIAIAVLLIRLIQGRSPV